MTRALVLSGGGAVGIAWQTGLTVGLARAGVRLADADFVVGTSAGSAVGAQIALGRDLEAQVARYGAASTEAAGRAASTGTASAGAAGMAQRMQGLMALMAEAGTSELPEEAMRSKIGAFALEAETGPEELFVNVFNYLAGEAWPTQYVCTAVEAATGTFQVWDAKTDAPLERAVASSCAVPGIFPPITINDKRYIDGGMRSGTNADLAAGHDRVLIVTLMGAQAAAGSDPRAVRARQRMESERAAITGVGGTIETVGPDAEAASAIGVNLMDGTRSAAAAAAGVAQGERIAADLSSFWS